MIPIRDRNPTRSRPTMVYAILGLNVAVFLYQISLEPAAMQEFVQRFGVVPFHLTQELHPGSFITPLTSMFMHGGWLHILGNMWFLWVFADNLEDNMGHVRFVAFYLLCGLGAAVGQIAINPASTIPMVGASGAISGVLGGYVMLFPHARVLTVIPIFIFLQFVELPAYIFIVVWFGFQFLSGLVALGQMGEDAGGVAWFAHIGGFLVGILLVRLFARKRGPTHGFRSGLDRYGSDPFRLR